jgi:hypothetical protein
MRVRALVRPSVEVEYAESKRELVDRDDVTERDVTERDVTERADVERDVIERARPRDGSLSLTPLADRSAAASR